MGCCTNVQSSYNNPFLLLIDDALIMSNLCVEARDGRVEIGALAEKAFALLAQDVKPLLLGALLEVEGNILRERGDLYAAVAHAFDELDLLARLLVEVSDAARRALDARERTISQGFFHESLYFLRALSYNIEEKIVIRASVT